MTLLLYYIFVLLSSFFLIFINHYSRLDQTNLLKLMKNKNLVVLSKLSLILIPSLFALIALLSVSFTRINFQILVLVDGTLDILSIFTIPTRSLFLGAIGISLAFTELLPPFPLFFLLCTGLFIIQLIFF